MRAPTVFAVAFLTAVPALAGPPQIAITLDAQHFVPSEVPVPAGTKVELLIKNTGATPAEFESTPLHREKVVPAGGQTSVFVGPLSPGRYEFFDDFNPATRGFLVAQ